MQLSVGFEFDLSIKVFWSKFELVSDITRSDLRYPSSWLESHFEASGIVVLTNCTDHGKTYLSQTETIMNDT